MRTSIRQLFQFAFLALCCVNAAAQTLTPHAAKWFGDGPGARIWAQSSCDAIMQRFTARAEAAAAPATVVWTSQPPCPGNPTGLTWTYRLSTDFPTTGDRQVVAHAYCGNDGAAGNATTGYSCPANSLSYAKNVGYCRTCGVGNPITPGYGNKFQKETDYLGSGPFPLRFERFYNVYRSGAALVVSDRPGLQYNWTHTYYRTLTFTRNSAGVTTFVSADRPDGKTIAFALSGSSYVTDPDRVERLQAVTNGWMLVNEDDETELYDSVGNLRFLMNRAGLAHTLNYDASGAFAGALPRSVSDPFGRMLIFQFDANAQIASMTDPAGGVYTYTGAADGNGGRNLVSVTYPDGKHVQYHYEDPPRPNLLTGITDERGIRYATYGYDSASRGSLTQNGSGAEIANKFTLSYANTLSPDPVGVTQYVSASSSATRTYKFQDLLGEFRMNEIASSTQPCPTCGPRLLDLDANGNVHTRIDWNDHCTSYQYDLSRNLETIRAEGRNSTCLGSFVRVTSTAWHPVFRLPVSVTEPLRVTTYVYNGDSGASCGFLADGVTLVPGVLCSKTVRDIASSVQRTWTYTYNANGQVLTANGPRTDVTDLTTYTYYPNNDSDPGRRGNVAAITNALNQATQVTAYNAHGQPLAIVDPNGLVTTLAYDARRRLTSRSVGGETTTYGYDDAGQLTSVTLPDGSSLTYTYDAAHRLKRIQDNLGNSIVYTLDIAGNRTKEEVFDAASVRVQTKSRVYSALNRLFQEVGAIGQVTEYGYDNEGNVLSTKDPLNRVTAMQYDTVNRLTRVTDPALGVTQYGYNGLDALTSVTDPRSLVTTYDVDGLGSLKQQVSPDTGTTANTYDPAGNLLTQTDAKGQVTTYVYDALNRVTQITFHDGSRQAYAYDTGVNGIGRLASITETNAANQVTSVIAYAYEAHGRVASETRTVNGVAYVLAYQYDASGRLSGLTYPSGRTVTYGFDALGRVNQVTTAKDGTPQVVVQNVTYHPFGGVNGFTFGNGQNYVRSYDSDGRTAGYSLGATSYAIGYDAASRIVFISDTVNAANGSSYGYDSLDRLTSATILPSTSYGYTYDAVGNRLSRTAGSATETLTYGSASNRIQSLTPFTGSPRSFSFDANGSTTNDGLNSYAYDTRGRMVQATSSVGTTGYQVNALGQRIRKTNSADDRVFTYDTWGKLIAESDPGGTPKREFIYLGDIPVGVLQ